MLLLYQKREHQNLNSTLKSRGTTNLLPANAVIIPASARGAFHLPPAANKPTQTDTRCPTLRANTPLSPPDDIPRNVVARRQPSHPTPSRHFAKCLEIDLDFHMAHCNTPSCARSAATFHGVSSSLHLDSDPAKRLREISWRARCYFLTPRQGWYSLPPLFLREITIAARMCTDTSGVNN